MSAEDQKRKRSTYDQAKELGIDVRGMRYKERKDAIQEAKDKEEKRKQAEDDMTEFIREVIRKEREAPIPEDPPAMPVISVHQFDDPGQPPPKANIEGMTDVIGGPGGGGDGDPIDFYCWKDGQIAIVKVLCEGEPTIVT